MNEQHHGNLLGGAIGETTQTAAQLAAIVATVAQTVARVQGRRVEADRARDQATADAERAVLRSEHAASRLAWAPAFERSFPVSASAPEAAGVWAAAQPWMHYDPTAHEAARRAEERLALLHPELIVRYQQAIAEGMEAGDAMAALLPADVYGAAAARALAGDERGEAQHGAATPDVATTFSIDEHTQGVRASATHGCVCDAAHARAALLATQAYPEPRGALGRGLRTGATHSSWRPRDLHRRQGR